MVIVEIDFNLFCPIWISIPQLKAVQFQQHAQSPEGNVRVFQKTRAHSCLKLWFLLSLFKQNLQVSFLRGFGTSVQQ